MLPQQTELTAIPRRSFFVMQAIEMSLPLSIPAFATPFCRRQHTPKSSMISKLDGKQILNQIKPQHRTIPVLRLFIITMIML